MINLTESQEKAVEVLTESFDRLTENMKEPIKKFTESINDRLVFYIEDYLSENIKYIIRESINDNLLALLSGDMQSLKRMAVISEYNWTAIDDVRMKIWQECAPDIEKSLIKKLESDIERLKDRIKYYDKEGY